MSEHENETTSSDETNPPETNPPEEEQGHEGTTPGEEVETGDVVGEPGSEVTAEDLMNVDPGDKLLTLQPTDPKERAEQAGLNVEGMNFDPNVGQAQLQAYANAVAESGTIPPTGGPPDDSHTVARVVEREAAEHEARIESMRETLSQSPDESSSDDEDSEKKGSDNE